MNFATLIFILIVFFFCWRGYQKGFMGSITPIISLLIAYPAAIFFSKPLANILIQHTALDGLLVYFIAGIIIFCGVSIIVTGFLKGISHIIPANNVTDSGAKIGGVAVGLISGCAIGLVAVYIVVLVKKPEATVPVVTIIESQDATQNNIAHPVLQLRDLEKSQESFIEASAKKLISNAAALAVDLSLQDKTATQVTKAFTEDPQSMLNHVQHVTNDEKIKLLLADEKIQATLSNGDVNALMQDAGFQALMNDPHMRALLETTGNPAAGEQAAAEKIVLAWQRMETIKNDPQVIAIVTDPEFQQQLNATNKLPLLVNPKLNQLTELIFNSKATVETPTVQSSYITGDSSPEKSTEEKSSPTIYRWTDENGKVHFSDKPAKSSTITR